MLRPCWQNPLLSAFEAMEGSFSFDATPMAPPGTEVLIHLKPTRRKSWSFHASNGWYIGPSLKHYRYIRALMEDTGSERLTDTFRFKHHAMTVPPITATDRIIAATRELTAAIEGTQESPPDKLQAIDNLHLLLLSETPPRPVPVDPPLVQQRPPPCPFVDEEPVHIWTPPGTMCDTSHSSPAPTTGPSLAHHPALITNDEDDVFSPIPGPTHPAHTRAQHCSQQHIHLINAIITESLHPAMDDRATTSHPPPGYIAATRTLLHNTYGIGHTSPTPSPTNPPNFIGAIVDDITGDVLEYRHLIKSDSHRATWQTSFANKLGRLFQRICDIKGTDTCFFIHRTQMPPHKCATYGRIVYSVRST